MMRALFLGVLMLMPSAALPAEPVPMALEGFGCRSSPYGITLPVRLSDLRKIGKIGKEKTIRTQEWDNYKAIEQSLHFPGLVIAMITFTTDKEKYYLSAASIESPSWDLGLLRVGEPSAPVLDRLGMKASSQSGEWQFYGESDSLVVQAREGKISRIVYDCYTG